MTISFKIIACISGAVIVLSLTSIIILERILEAPEIKSEKRINDTVKVAVLNGCGREELASMFAQKLRNQGFDVVNGMGENADSFDFDISVVLDRKGARKKAEVVAEALGISHILNQRSDNPYIIEDVVVILGRDWNTFIATKGDGTD